MVHYSMIEQFTAYLEMRSWVSKNVVSPAHSIITPLLFCPTKLKADLYTYAISLLPCFVYSNAA